VRASAKTKIGGGGRGGRGDGESVFQRMILEFETK